MPLRALLLAFACYAAVSAWFHWDVLRAPTTVLPQLASANKDHDAIVWGDEQMVAATIAIVARRLLTAPSRLFDLGQCWPFPNSLSLGEPMFVNGLVGTVPYALTGDPILVKNFVVVSAPVLAALTMFALVFYWTGSTGAALVAGLLFGFEPARLTDVSHPYIHGNAWAPLALLAAHRLFARRRWRDAALLAVALALQMLESFYPALAFAMVGGVYGTALAVHHRRVLPALWPKLSAVAAFLVAVALFAFTPYLANREAWGILQGRGSLLMVPADFHYGGPAYLGTVLLALAAVGLCDRMRRGAGIVFDPRLPLLAGAAVIYWFVVWHINIPFVGTFPSLYLLGMRDLPGINAVRAVTAVRSALPLVGACLAGFGVAAILRRCGPRTGAALTALFLVLAAGETFFWPASGSRFGVRLRGIPAKPSAALVALYERLPEGPVLDFPPSRYIPPTTHYVFLHGYHDRPTDACHSSFPSPMREEVYTMSAYLPHSIQALRLRTLGFRSIMVHTEYLEQDRLDAFERWAAGDGRRAAGLRRVGEADGHIAYVFDSPPTTPAGFESLAPPDVVSKRAQALDVCGQPIGFVFQNSRHSFYRHPDPIRLSRVSLAWLDDLGVARATESRVALLPLALLPGGRQTVKIVPGTLPPPGGYTVVLRLGDDAGPVLARQRVVVADG
ncbi:MAG TPA: hypothetical protein VNO26_09930 [Candidatus Limnocylindria bacterium]|nr:hypothetical protein [Candidatus Limnocylindria bacterium]